MDNKITAVLGIWLGLERTKQFVQDLRTRFPDIHVAIGILGNTEEYQKDLQETFKGDSYIKFATGAFDRRIPFSENWDAAINLVETERFVLLHNDMYVHDKFFENLNQLMDEHSDNFFLYTTVEPLENRGFVRPGKIVAPFGYDFDDFQKDRFNAFADKYIVSHSGVRYGYGFYLGGFTECLKKVGGFDFHRFVPIFCEDDDINLRIRLAGYKIIVADKALVYHFGSKTIRQETNKSMSPIEIESNRNFARKWGFEARFLWETGYENKGFSIGTEKIQCRYRNYVPTYTDVINSEPLVESLIVDEPSEDIKKYFTGKLASKLNSSEPADIVITQIGPTDFIGFANLIGSLRFRHKDLVPGAKAIVGPYEVEIINTYPGICRVDTENYLSEQDTINYE